VDSLSPFPRVMVLQPTNAGRHRERQLNSRVRSLVTKDLDVGIPMSPVLGTCELRSDRVWQIEDRSSVVHLNPRLMDLSREERMKALLHPVSIRWEGATNDEGTRTGCSFVSWQLCAEPSCWNFGFFLSSAGTPSSPVASSRFACTLQVWSRLSAARDK